jgi:hypothetical protein
MNYATDAGHPDLIPNCTAAVIGAVVEYTWICLPGMWLTYLLVIGIPHPRAVVRPPARRYTNSAPTALLLSAKRAAAKAAPGADLTPTGRLRRRKPPAVFDTNPIELVPDLPEELGFSPGDVWTADGCCSSAQQCSATSRKLLDQVVQPVTVQSWKCRTATQDCE